MFSCFCVLRLDNEVCNAKLSTTTLSARPRKIVIYGDNDETNNVIFSGGYEESEK